jgi:hypothetical protein
VSALAHTLVAVVVGGLVASYSGLRGGQPDRTSLLTEGHGEFQTALGSIAGCAIDLAGGTLPGVTIAVDRAGRRRQVATDAKGCYEVPSLEPGDYSVEATLAGFRTMTRTGVIVLPDETTRVDLSLCVAGLMEHVWVLPRSYEDLVKMAAAVVHVRISATRLEPDCEDSWIHTAQVLHVVKPTAGLRSGSIEMSQFRSSTEPTPYRVGTELILGISLGRSGRFERTAGPFGVYNVTGGRVVRAREWGTTRYDNMKLDDYLEALRALVK